MRILWLLNENQKTALRALKIEGLQMLNINEMQMRGQETWIEYWIDADQVTEDNVRTRIHLTLLNTN
jgi:hypothetical protein